MARKFWVAAAIFVISITLRFDPAAAYPPYDDLYHAKRIAYSAANFPHVLGFDRDRGLTGAFCPWPPLYDLACAALSLGGAPLRWLPPIGFSIFAGAVAFALGPVAGIGIAISPGFSDGRTRRASRRPRSRASLECSSARSSSFPSSRR